MADIDRQDAALLSQIAQCVQSGKTNATTDIPRGSIGKPGVVELVGAALEAGHAARNILNDGLLCGMNVIGKRFAANEVFIPEVLVSARAMKAGIELLRPHFAETDMPSRGDFVIGTVRGDLHDIGKNLVAIILEGAGWRIHDLGVDCSTDVFLNAIEKHPNCVVGLSALLTTTMTAMRESVTAIRRAHPETVILVGGAPVTAEFAEKIGASGYAADPAQAAALLDDLVSAN